ncbi:hypothetical protein GDO86_002937 [Hymenochirus boettgeri]|uniref:Uncharacterized protein n=1 Tax=Hymenochirus boettgeri TaxID=247094 RepID=A0A8T2K7E6_9PIPI|nr:hypothetical protein GDO86_002937 [Hymenochirus boettgeri]
MKLDLASLDSVRSFCKAFLSAEPRLDILINNAAVLWFWHPMLIIGKFYFNKISSPAESISDTLQSYCDSKLCNILFARELANRLQGTGVTCYSVHPGTVHTSLGRNMPSWIKAFIIPFGWLFLRTSTDGAQTSIYCAIQEGIEMYSGRYFDNCQVREVQPQARDDAVAKKLWEASERMTGLAS